MAAAYDSEDWCLDLVRLATGDVLCRVVSRIVMNCLPTKPYHVRVTAAGPACGTGLGWAVFTHARGPTIYTGHKGDIVLAIKH
jgi:hypothetical protein